MSLFKKDINEHDEFFDMVRDYVIAKAAAGKVRLASASLLMMGFPFSENNKRFRSKNSKKHAAAMRLLPSMNA